MYTKRFHLIEFKFIKTYLFYFFNFNKYMNKYFKTKVFINNTIRIEVFIFYIYQKDNDFFKILKHQLIWNKKRSICLIEITGEYINLTIGNYLIIFFGLLFIYYLWVFITYFYFIFNHFHLYKYYFNLF